MDAKSSMQRAILAAILFVAGAVGTAFGDPTSTETTALRGTPHPVQQLQMRSPVQAVPPGAADLS